MQRLIGLWLLLVIAAPVTQAAGMETTASQVFAIASPSIVVVNAVDSSGKLVAQGSGVVIANDTVVSNCHVFENRRTATASVVYRDKSYPAILRYADVEHDLCSFTVDGLKAPPVQMRPSATLKIGEDAYAIGAPEGYSLTLSSGIVSSLRKILGGVVIQTTAPISPGSSGGGLFDSEGRLIGITSYYAKEGQQINFALPVEWIQTLPQHGKTLGQLADQGAPSRPESPDDTKAWQAYLSRIVMENLGGIANTPYLYFVPMPDTDASLAALGRIQDQIDNVVASTVLPGNMVAFGGPSSAATAYVVETAFKQAGPGSFRGVVVLFIGDEADEAAVRVTVLPSGATFKFAQM